MYVNISFVAWTQRWNFDVLVTVAARNNIRIEMFIKINVFVELSTSFLRAIFLIYSTIQVGQYSTNYMYITVFQKYTSTQG